MDKKLIIITLREFNKALRTWGFWLMTLGFPLMYIAIGGISYFSQIETSKSLEEKNAKIDHIYIYSENNLIEDTLGNPKIVFVESATDGQQKFLASPNNLYLHYPKDLVLDNHIEMWVDSENIMDDYSSLVTPITRGNILAHMQDSAMTIESYQDSDLIRGVTYADLAELYASTPTFSTTRYHDGAPAEDLTKQIVIGIIGAVTYFLMIIFGNSRMLNSMIQEKESRMIEIILSTVRPTIFVAGKILGGLLLTAFQLFLVICVPIFVVLIFHIALPMDIASILSGVSIGTWLVMIFYVLIGFLTFAGLMVLAGSASSNQKEAGSYSAIFILLGILPIYFASVLIADPQGTIAMILSYCPITSPLILLFRASIGALAGYEYFLGPIVVIIYMFVSFWLAGKMFSLGAMEFSRKIAFFDIFHRKNTV